MEEFDLHEERKLIGQWPRIETSMGYVAAFTLAVIVICILIIILFS